MKKIVCCLAVALLAGCSQDWSQGIEGRHGAATQSSEAAATLAMGSASGPASRASTGSVDSFANLPDRGDLVDYAPDSTTRRRGAYTMHAVALSEEHAINAIVRGQMTVTAPDGTPIRMRYDRHVEHDNGTWTWVGTTADGGQGLITFGADAAFGSIPQGSQQAPLRLTMSDGRAWIVATDRAMLAAVDMEATDPTGPDYFVPPKLTAGGSTSLGMSMAGAAPVAAGAAANTVVDVLVGYTDGFAAAIGGQSAARTRIQNLVDITNQAYINSQVDAEVRLVATMQVNYPDATDNGDALEDLTGFIAPSTQTEPDPRFAALRAARDQYGADLVTLVRDFNTPENGGCGVAWLIGGGMTGISVNDAFFGYSVVSDGIDAGTDGNYTCREETFAHELGHNMGSQHDESSSEGESGVYAYSYGYKNTANELYTVMAYGDDGQYGYRVFSNPDLTYCGGKTCGVENQADNARSLRQTIPIVAGFRDSVVPSAESYVTRDVNGDGKSDILLRYYQTAPNNFGWWVMNGAGRADVRYDSLGASYDIVATGDFNGDGKMDLVWAADSVRNAVMWLGTGTSWIKRSLGIYGLGWRIAGAGDVNGDGKSDLLWRYYKTAPNNFVWWIMDGSNRVSSGSDSIGVSYDIAATGDFDGDGKLDVVWAANSVRRAYMWLGTGTSWISRSLGVYGLGWSIAGAGDINGDGKSDLMFRYYKTAPNNYNYWIMDGANRTAQGFGSVGASYRIATTGDYNGDGKLDIIWCADSIRRLYMSEGNATNFRLLATYGLGWSVVGK